MRKLGLLAFFSAMHLGCASGGKQATLVNDSVSPQWVKETFGEVTRSELYSPPEWDFNTTIRLTKESVIGNATLSTEEKEQAFAQLKALPWVPDGYLVYFFRLHEPVLVKTKEFKFELADREGKSLIEKIVPFANKVTVIQGSRRLTSYNFGWLLQLSKPLTKANFPAGSYRVTVGFPNGQSRMFELSL
jgi:hypothetical protein